MTVDLSGRIAVVTAGSSGIGRAAAVALARAGATVVTGDIRPREENRPLFDQLGIRQLACDVRREEQVRALIDEAAGATGQLHILVSNAGIDLVKQVPDVSEAEWDACLDTNLKGAFLACKHAIPRLRAAGGGSVVFTASNAGLLPRAHDPVYSTSKAALIALRGRWPCRTRLTRFASMPFAPARSRARSRSTSRWPPLATRNKRGGRSSRPAHWPGPTIG